MGTTPDKVSGMVLNCSGHAVVGNGGGETMNINKGKHREKGLKSRISDLR